MGVRQGFTLVEMILALVIFSIIGVSLYTVFANGIFLQQRAQSVGFVSRELQWTLQQITQDIENAVYYDFSGSYPERRSVSIESEGISLIVSQEQGLIYVTYKSVPEERSHQYVTVVDHDRSYGDRMILEKEEKDLSWVLIREERPFVDVLRGSMDDNLRSEVMCRHIHDQVRWSFLDFSLIHQSDWMAVWNKPELPKAIRVQFDYLLEKQVFSVKRTVHLPVSDYVHDFVSNQGDDYNETVSK